MTAFAAAAQTLHQDPNGSEAGVYVAVGGGSASVRVVRTRNDPQIDGLDLKVRHAGWRLELLQADVPTRPTAGATAATADQLTVAGTTYYVRDVEEDEQRTVWRCDVMEVP